MASNNQWNFVILNSLIFSLVYVIVSDMNIKYGVMKATLSM